MTRVSLTVLVILFFAMPTGRAAQPLEVTSLDLGGCWVNQERFEDALWKVASFSDRVAVTVVASQFQQSLNTPISMELQKVFSNFQGSATETYFHCSAAGHFFWTGIHEGTVPLCVWSKMAYDRDSGSLGLSLLGVYPDYDFRPSGPCYGVSRRRLLVVLNQGSDITAVTAYFRTNKRYAGVVEDLSSIGQTILLLQLAPAYDFSENVAKTLIESDDQLAKDLRIVQYDGRVATSGEDLNLFNGNYPGF